MRRKKEVMNYYSIHIRFIKTRKQCIKKHVEGIKLISMGVQANAATLEDKINQMHCYSLLCLVLPLRSIKIKKNKFYSPSFILSPLFYFLYVDLSFRPVTIYFSLQHFFNISSNACLEATWYYRFSHHIFLLRYVYKAETLL